MHTRYIYSPAWKDIAAVRLTLSLYVLVEQAAFVLLGFRSNCATKVIPCTAAFHDVFFPIFSTDYAGNYSQRYLLSLQLSPSLLFAAQSPVPVLRC